MGAEAVLLPPVAAGMAAPTVAQLEAVWDERVKGLWLASPVNPTGAVIAADQMKELSAWAKFRGVHLLMDEIYHGLDFIRPIADVTPMGDLPTALAFDDDNFVVNSFSKYYGMTGWRVGWLVLPQSLSARANILAQNLFIAAATPSQYAALRAMDADVVEIHEQRRAAFRTRRDFLARALQSLGFELPWQPDGAFYCYAAIDRFGDDCEQFCRRMLTDHSVAITPGTDFGDFRARQFVRFAYTRSLTDLEKAVERLQRALQNW
jgi:aspartate/methionine/tyrosine aminotransferase